MKRNRTGLLIAMALASACGGCRAIPSLAMLPGNSPGENNSGNEAPLGEWMHDLLEWVTVGSVISIPISLGTGNHRSAAIGAGVAVFSITAIIQKARRDEMRAAEREKERLIREARDANPEMRPEEVVLAYPLPGQTGSQRRVILIDPDTGKVLDRVIVISEEEFEIIADAEKDPPSGDPSSDSNLPVAEGRRVVFVGFD